jgi:hypothetical protein
MHLLSHTSVGIRVGCADTRSIGAIIIAQKSVTVYNKPIEYKNECETPLDIIAEQKLKRSTKKNHRFSNTNKERSLYNSRIDLLKMYNCRYIGYIYIIYCVGHVHSYLYAHNIHHKKIHCKKKKYGRCSIHKNISNNYNCT